MSQTTTAVLFDYDDTLVQTRQCKYRAIAALGRRFYGAEIAEAIIDRHWGIEYRQLFRKLFEGIDDNVERVIQRYESLNDEFPVVPYPDTLATIDGLLRRPLTLGIVTSAGDIVHQQLKRMAMPVERMAVIQTAADTEVHKPDPRVFAPALRQLAQRGIPASEVAYVGDSLRDFEAARDASLRFVGIFGRTTPEVSFTDAGARAVASLSELLQEFPHAG